jgi:hypothetical protein
MMVGLYDGESQVFNLLSAQSILRLAGGKCQEQLAGHVLTFGGKIPHRLYSLFKQFGHPKTIPLIGPAAQSCWMLRARHAGNERLRDPFQLHQTTGGVATRRIRISDLRLQRLLLRNGSGLAPRHVAFILVAAEWAALEPVADRIGRQPSLSG